MRPLNTIFVAILNLIISWKPYMKKTMNEHLNNMHIIGERFYEIEGWIMNETTGLPTKNETFDDSEKNLTEF